MIRLTQRLPTLTAPAVSCRLLPDAASPAPLFRRASRCSRRPRSRAIGAWARRGTTPTRTASRALACRRSSEAAAPQPRLPRVWRAARVTAM
eukprot:49124-Prymnesium_polylepis.2